jgi:hypothetical protein
VLKVIYFMNALSFLSDLSEIKYVGKASDASLSPRYPMFKDDFHGKTGALEKVLTPSIYLLREMSG